MTHWVETIAPLAVNENTMVGYGVAVRKHLIPALGSHRLDKLRPEHIERFYGNMMIDGRKAGMIHQIHRTFRTALNEAVRRGHLGRNPVQLAKAPASGKRKCSPTPSKRFSGSCGPPTTAGTPRAGPLPSHSDFGRGRRSDSSGMTLTCSGAS